MEIRPATERDLAGIFAIYNDEILHGVSIFETRPIECPDEQRAWLAAHARPQRPAVVAVEHDRVLGWASLSDFSPKPAYARSAENSVYVHQDARRRGVGRRALEEALRLGREAGVAVVLARICTECQASVALHRALGFERVGIMRRVGEKFGRVLDVELMSLSLEKA